MKKIIQRENFQTFCFKYVIAWKKPSTEWIVQLNKLNIDMRKEYKFKDFLVYQNKSNEEYFATQIHVFYVFCINIQLIFGIN